MFDTETPFSIYIDTCDDDGNEIMADEIEDRYGERLRYCNDKKALLRQANKIIKEEEKKYGEGKGYWLFYVMREMIKSFAEQDNIRIVHYGY